MSWYTTNPLQALVWWIWWSPWEQYLIWSSSTRRMTLQEQIWTLSLPVTLKVWSFVFCWRWLLFCKGKSMLSLPAEDDCSFARVNQCFLFLELWKYDLSFSAEDYCSFANMKKPGHDCWKHELCCTVPLVHRSNTFAWAGWGSPCWPSCWRQNDSRLAGVHLRNEELPWGQPLLEC